MKKIDSFKGVKHLSFMCIFKPSQPSNQKHWVWEVEYEQEETTNADLLYNTFEIGGKKIQREIFDFLEMYYHLKILPKVKGLTMYHGTRQVLCLQIINEKPYIHYQNTIHSSFDEVDDFESDNTHEIKGKYQFDFDPRIWDFKKLLLDIFNRNIK